MANLTIPEAIMRLQSDFHYLLQNDVLCTAERLQDLETFKLVDYQKNNLIGRINATTVQQIFTAIRLQCVECRLQGGLHPCAIATIAATINGPSYELRMI